MKIIELLNKIANGEEVPKKIKYKNRILYLEDEAEDYEPTFNYYDKDGENALFEGWIGQYLNDEVEIIEEDKKIEKLDTWYGLEPIKLDSPTNFKENAKYIDHNIEMFFNKINEIIDYLMENKQ